MKHFVDTYPPPWFSPPVERNDTTDMTTAQLTEQDLLEAKKTLLKLKKKQDELREQELEIRTYLADVLHDGEEGSKTITVGEVKLTIQRVLNRSITRDEAERLSTEHPDISLEALSWRPEVKVSGYKEHQAVMDEYITTRPGPPTVTFK
jgi:hypothetical protein